MAIPVAMLCWPTITRMAEIMLASAESGDCAAPTFIQPSAISSSVPPSIIPVFNRRELSQSRYRRLMGGASEIHPARCPFRQYRKK
jgi:hypothetical protein